MSDPPLPRKRAASDADDKIEAILRDYFDAPTRVGDYGPGLESNKIVRHRKLLVQLHAVQVNLSFTQLTMQRLCTPSLWTSLGSLQAKRSRTLPARAPIAFAACAAT